MWPDSQLGDSQFAIVYSSRTAVHTPARVLILARHTTKDEHPEIFYMVPWSHGTLGFLTAATIKMIPAKE